MSRNHVRLFSATPIDTPFLNHNFVTRCSKFKFIESVSHTFKWCQLCGLFAVPVSHWLQLKSSLNVNKVNYTFYSRLPQHRFAPLQQFWPNFILIAMLLLKIPPTASSPSQYFSTNQKSWNLFIIFELFLNSYQITSPFLQTLYMSILPFQRQPLITLWER